MDLFSLVLLMTITLVFYQFWRLRAVAEYIIPVAKQYCTKENLQFISIARKSTRFKAYKGKLDWHLTYFLYFSSDGENEYIGEIVCHGKHMVSIQLPAFRINSD